MIAIHFRLQLGSQWHVRHQIVLRDMCLGPEGNSVRAALLETQALESKAKGKSAVKANTMAGDQFTVTVGEQELMGRVKQEREQRHIHISLKLDRYATTEIYLFISLNSYSCVCILNIQAHLI